jgi:hypothetical protein
MRRGLLVHLRARRNQQLRGAWLIFSALLRVVEAASPRRNLLEVPTATMIPMSCDDVRPRARADCFLMARKIVLGNAYMVNGVRTTCHHYNKACPT